MMKMQKTILLMLAALCLSMTVSGQQERKFVRKGNRAYVAGDYEAAAASYRKGLEKKPISYEANFNMGNALYQSGQYDTAYTHYIMSNLEGDLPIEKQARTFHNLGNTFLEQQKYQEAIDLYKQALRLNPNDADTRYNLVYAMKKRQEEQQNQDQQDQDQDQQNQDQQDQDQQNQDQQQQNQDQQNQDQQDQDQQNQDQQNQDQQNEDQQNQEQQDQNQQNQDQQNQEQQQQQKIRGNKDNNPKTKFQEKKQNAFFKLYNLMRNNFMKPLIKRKKSMASA